MIAVSHLCKRFGSLRAVDDISFTVEEGEHFVLLGTSGCGKTTTLKMINRLLEPDGGSVMINGKLHDEQPPELLRRTLGYVLQNIGLFPHYTIAENIAVVPQLLGWPDKKIQARSSELLAKFNLDPETYLSLYPHQLSGGQQQRVGFTRALVADPPILLMDEPLGALDPITRHQMRKEFKRLNELKGKTIILVTHDISEAIELGDRVGIMDSGKMQQIDTAANLLLHPVNDFVKQFFAHDRFMLQLRAYSLEDLFPFLPEIDVPMDEGCLEQDTSLLDTMEELSHLRTEKNELVVRGEEQNNFYRISLTTLFMALQRKENQRS